MQIEGQTGYIGCFQTGMSEDGKGAFPKWSSGREGLNTEEFQQELAGVMDALIHDEQYGGFLKDSDALRDFCQTHPESGFNNGFAFGFRADTAQYSYLIRLNPCKGEENLSICCYLLCFRLVRERVEVPANNEKLKIGRLLKSLITNRSLLGIIAAAIALLLAMLTMGGMAGYVFPNYYGSPAAQSISSLTGSLAVLVICAPFAARLSAKMGKKELAFVGCLASAVIFLICLIVHPANPFVYVGFFTLAYIGLGFFNTIIWAMITDVIDDAEVKNGVREDGTIYSVYSFARKLGQALSSGLTGSLLTMIGYTQATAFDPVITERIFKLSCIAPIIGFTLVAVFLWFIYPLNKRRVEENVEVLARRRGK